MRSRSGLNGVGCFVNIYEIGNDIFRRVMGHYGYYAFYGNKVRAYL